MIVDLSTSQAFLRVNKAKITVVNRRHVMLFKMPLMHDDISVVKKNFRIKRRFFALLYGKEVLIIESCTEIAVLGRNI
jgi:hypothetical protein